VKAAEEKRAMVFALFLTLLGLCRLSFVIDGFIWLLHKLAVTCLNSGDYARALIAYKVILRVRPADELATFQSVQVYRILSRDDEAIKILENWLQLAPNNIDAHLTLSQLYTAINEMTKAREHLDALAQLAPNSPELLLTYGYFYRWSGNLDESSALVSSTLKDGEGPAGLTLLAQNLIDQGKRGEALKILERAVGLAPDTPLPYYLLARCRRYRDLSHPHVEYMERRVAKGDLPAHVGANFHFALGEVFDGLGQWDAAFAHFKAGNDLQRVGPNSSMAELTKYIDQQIATFTKEFVSGDQWAPSRSTGDSLIFILGMPRSGTTLVEQILSSHPDVRAGGERYGLSPVIQQLCSAVNQPYPVCVSRLDRRGVDHFAQSYLSAVTPVTRGVGRFVDKALDNWNAAGLIAILFPRATFVHCQRNPLDTCLSCYLTYLPHVRFATDLMTLGHFYRQYERLMAHWRSVFSDRICDLEYEELVSDPEAQIRKLLAHCELPWHDGCLTPHQNERVVLTASASQVKVPIHSRSVGRWKNYEKHIGPLIQALGRKDGHAGIGNTVP
jgi:tetratricopeptide (TPR) repeat protein